MSIKTLSVMIDESGDFDAPWEPGTCKDRFYIVALVLHDQTNPAEYPDFAGFDAQAAEANECAGLAADQPIHTGNLIRREKPYRGVSIRQRIRLFDLLVNFAISCKGHRVHLHPITVDRAMHLSGQTMPSGLAAIDGESVQKELESRMMEFIRDSRFLFERFDIIRIYYDNGQKRLARIIHEAFNSAFAGSGTDITLDYKSDVKQSDYRLLQVADLACTMELLDRKVQAGELGSSDVMFFDASRKAARAERRIRRVAEGLAPLRDLR